MATTTGTSGNDSLIGSAAMDEISGLAGNDTLSGAAGNDVISGSAGNDVVEGGNGTDRIYGGTGNDYLAGNDLTDPAAAAAAGNLSPAVSLEDSAADMLDGGAGADTIFGGGGSDLLLGGSENDILDGGAGADTLIGGTGADTIFGGDDNDLISGDDAAYTPFGAGFGQSGSAFAINQTTTGDQSPPKMVTLQDGRVLYAWSDATGTLNVRIFAADGSPSTDQFALSSQWGISAGDSFDWDSLDLDRLADGRVMLSYVRVSTSGGEEPVFSILNPAIEPGSPGFVAVSNVEVQGSDTTTTESPPVTTVLANGNVLFVWSNNALTNTTATILEGRIYDPSTGNWVTSDFRIGTVAIDGLDTADVNNLSVLQLTGGNIVVGFVRSNSESGGIEPVYTVLDQNGNTVLANAEMQQTDSTVWESPPVMTSLADGRWIAVWANNGYSDDITSMTLEARIFNADGTPATGDISLGAAVDGSDAFDLEHISIAQLSGGRVVVGYVETYATGTTTYPEFVIIDPATGSVVVTPQQIAVSPSNIWPGPPKIVALGDTGAFVAVYAEGNQFSATAAGINYRIFDASGNALTGQIAVTGTSGNAALDNSDGFDWDNVQVIYNASNNSFVISWAGSSDGAGTGAYSSGPIAAPGGLTSPTIDPLAGSGDSLDGGAGNDTITGAGGNDTIAGGSGNDSLYGGAGNDSLAGGTGADLLDGGDGTDSLTAAQGDTVSGGAGDDRITLADLAEAGTAGLTITGGDGFDTLDLAQLTVRGSTVRSGNGTTGYSGTMTMLDGSVITFSGIESIVCFTRGTAIATPLGQRPIEALTKGDLVLTPSGLRPIRWIGHRRLDTADLAANPKLAPVRIPAGALGPGLPGRSLTVSPQHRILIANRVAERMFDSPAILVPAKDLVGSFGIAQLPPTEPAEYWHLLLDGHHVVQAEGAWAETLFPGEEAMKGLSCAAREEILTLFPQLAAGPARLCFPPAYPLLRGARVQRMVQRCAANRRDLVETALPEASLQHAV